MLHKKSKNYTNILTALIILTFTITLFFVYLKGYYAISFCIFSILSVLCLSIASFHFIRNISNRSGQSLKSNMLFPIVFLFFSIWILRFNVSVHTNLFGIMTPDRLEVDGLNTFEHIFNSLVHALQSFSMDEDYTTFITAGKEFILNIPCNGNYMPVIATIYGGYCAFINFLAPVAGGAILFDILTNVYPLLRLRMNLLFHRKTYSHIFSELNVQAITLAKSIRESNPKDFIVFTDVYHNEDGDEQLSEWILEAKRIGALCLETDLSILKELAWGPVNYYLLDQDQSGNLEALATLSSTQKSPTEQYTFFEMWKEKDSCVNIFIFADYPFLDEMIENFNALCQQYGIAKQEKGNQLTGVTAKPINMSELLSYKLLSEYPLYSSVITCPKPSEKEKVKILLMGDTSLTRHYLKNAYWCGQMLNPYCGSELPLRIYPEFYIICPECDSIKDYISSNMPAVYKEMQEEHCEFPYTKFHFVDAELSYSNIASLVKKMDYVDFCIISTGDDLTNIDLTSITKKILDQHYLLCRQKCDLLCYVENAELNHVTNQLNPAGTNNSKYIQTHYIGNLQDQLDYSSILITSLEEETSWVKQSYHYGPLHELYTNLYAYRSSLASALHYPYRLFSTGVFMQNNQDYMSYNTKETRFSIRFLEKLIGISLRKTTTSNSFHYTKEEHHRLNHLFWLEKIRWNCFVKSYGYQIPLLSEVRNFYEITGKFTLHKASEINSSGIDLHACIMDLPKPIGIVLNDIRKEEGYKTMEKQMMDCFLHKEFPKDTTFPEFLQYVLENVSGCPDAMDILDVFSILAGNDYKDYDLQQIPAFTIARLLRNMQIAEKEIAIGRIFPYLEQIVESEAYLSPQFTNVLNTVQKLTH